MKFQTDYLLNYTGIKNKIAINLLVILGLSGFTSEVAAQQLEYESPGIVDNIPVLYENLATRLVYPLSRINSSNTDYATWQNQARNKVMECLLLRLSLRLLMLR